MGKGAIQTDVRDRRNSRDASRSPANWSMRSSASNIAAMIPPASPRSITACLARRRAEGKLQALETRLEREPLGGNIGIGHTRWATHGRPTEDNAHPHATDRRRGRAQRHHREFSRAARAADEARLQIRQRDRYRGGRASGHAGDEERQVAGRCGGGRAQATARRFRARLPVHRQGRSADRRAQRIAARHRLRQGRDVSRLRCDRAGAVHRHDQLSRRRRLGGAHAQGRARSTTSRAARSSGRSSSRLPRRNWSTRATTSTSWPRKSTSSRKWSATRSRITSTW